MTALPERVPLPLPARLLRNLTVLLLMVTAAVVSGQEPPVQVLLGKGSGIYQEALDSFQSHLQEKGGTPRALEIILTENDSPDSPVITRGTVITIGAHAAASLSGLDNSPSAILNILIPSSVHHKLAGQSAAGNRAATIVLDQPVARQLALIRLVLPEAQRVGVLLGPNSSALLDELHQETARYHLELVSMRMEGEEDPVPSIRTLLDSTDVILAINDPAILDPTTSKWLLYMAYRKRIPVIGFSEGYTRAGALASLYSTPEQIGRQAAELVARRGIRPGTVMPPAYFSVSTNATVARLLGISLPDESELTRRLGAAAP